MSDASPISTDHEAEQVFEEPWQARAFALMVTLSESGVFTRSEFQEALIARVGGFEKAGCIVSQADYYTCWVEALSDLLAVKGFIPHHTLTEAEHHVRDDAASRKAHQHGQPRDEHGRPRIAPIVVDLPVA